MVPQKSEVVGTETWRCGGFHPYAEERRTKTNVVLVGMGKLKKHKFWKTKTRELCKRILFL